MASCSDFQGRHPGLLILDLEVVAELESEEAGHDGIRNLADQLVVLGGGVVEHHLAGTDHVGVLVDSVHRLAEVLVGLEVGVLLDHDIEAAGHLVHETLLALGVRGGAEAGDGATLCDHVAQGVVAN